MVIYCVSKLRESLNKDSPTFSNPNAAISFAAEINYFAFMCEYTPGTNSFSVIDVLWAPLSKEEINNSVDITVDRALQSVDRLNAELYYFDHPGMTDHIFDTGLAKPLCFEVVYMDIHDFRIEFAGTVVWHSDSDNRLLIQERDAECDIFDDIYEPLEITLIREAEIIIQHMKSFTETFNRNVEILKSKYHFPKLRQGCLNNVKLYI